MNNDNGNNVRIDTFGTFVHALYAPNKDLFDPFDYKIGSYSVPERIVAEFARDNGFDCTESLLSNMDKSISDMLRAYADERGEFRKPMLYYTISDEEGGVRGLTERELIHNIHVSDSILIDRKGILPRIKSELRLKFEKEYDTLADLHEESKAELLKRYEEQGIETESDEDGYMYIEFLGKQSPSDYASYTDALRDLNKLSIFFDNVSAPKKDTKQAAAEFKHCEKMKRAARSRVYKYLNDTASHRA